MTRKNRKHTADQKAQAVRRHWCDKVPVSELAAELDVPPSQIHNWINQAKQSLKRQVAGIENPLVVLRREQASYSPILRINIGMLTFLT